MMENMKKINILIVEDEGIIAQGLKSQLESLGYNIIGIASSGSEAIKKVKKTRPDIILIDINLNGKIDGVETSKRISRILDIPVIFITANSDEATLRRAKIAKPFGYLIKPVEKRELHTTIEIALYRHKLEQKVKDNEEIFHAISSSIKDAVILIDEKSEITFWNKTAARIFGYSKEEALGCLIHELLAPAKLRQAAIEGFKKFNEAGTGRIIGKTFDIYALRKDGEEIPIELSVSAVIIKDKRYAVAVCRDITEYIEVNETLKNAKDAADSANRAKSTFLASISHELRTPLNSIIGFTELIINGSMGSLNSKQNKFLKIVLENSEHLLSLINDVLDLSKIETGKVKLELKRFNLAKLLHGCLEMIKGIAVKRHVQLLPEIDNAAELIADDQKVRQIIYNLLSNAVKFTPSGGQVGVKVSKSSEKYIITIWDTGIGIREEYQQMIFGEFQQVDISYTRKYHGAGLGLALCKKFVELHNGEIWVESEFDKGSRFSFSSPIRKLDIGYPDKPTNSIKFKDVSTGNKIVLVVDDEENNLLLASEVLKNNDYEVYHATNGKSAIKIANAIIPDIILLDIQMPEMDGKTVLKILKKDPQTADIPIIAMTAYAMKGDDDSFLEFGFDGYISIPININTLAENINTLAENIEQMLIPHKKIPI